MTISILGCGWLGLPLAKHLVSLGHSVKGSTTSTVKFEEFQDENIAPFILKMDMLQETDSTFFSSEILVIAIPYKNIEHFKQLSILLENTPIKKVLFVSSTSVYSSENKKVSEETKTNESPLAIIEKVLKENNNFETTIVRFSGLFGANRHPGNFIKEGRIMPNPNGFINLIHQDDCVNILEGILSIKIWGEVFNASADVSSNRKEFYEFAAKQLGKEAPSFSEEKGSWKIVDNSKIKQALQYTFVHPNPMLSL